MVKKTGLHGGFKLLSLLKNLPKNFYLSSLFQNRNHSNYLFLQFFIKPDVYFIFTYTKRTKNMKQTVSDIPIIYIP